MSIPVPAHCHSQILWILHRYSFPGDWLFERSFLENWNLLGILIYVPHIVLSFLDQSTEAGERQKPPESFSRSLSVHVPVDQIIESCLQPQRAPSLICLLFLFFTTHFRLHAVWSLNGPHWHGTLSLWEVTMAEGLPLGIHLWLFWVFVCKFCLNASGRHASWPLNGLPKNRASKNRRPICLKSVIWDHLRSFESLRRCVSWGWLKGVEGFRCNHLFRKRCSTGVLVERRD